VTAFGFYKLDRSPLESALPRLLERVVERGLRALVLSTSQERVESLDALLPFIFQEIGLHRVEAACIPTNEASRRLLQRLGFTQEGYARRYLCINGVWQDHLLFAMLASDLNPGGPAA